MDLAHSAFPHRPARVLAYAFGWTLTVGALTLVMARLDRLFQALYDKGELPRLTRVFWGFARLNTAAFSLPAILLLLSLLMLDEVVVRALDGWPHAPLYSGLWFAFWLLAGLAVNALFLLAVWLP
jgi:hypothetical protein